MNRMMTFLSITLASGAASLPLWVGGIHASAQEAAVEMQADPALFAEGDYGTLLLGVDQGQAQSILEERGLSNLFEMTQAQHEGNQPYLLILTSAEEGGASTVFADPDTFRVQAGIMAQQMAAEQNKVEPSVWVETNDITQEGMVPGHLPDSPGTIIFVPAPAIPSEPGMISGPRQADHALCQQRIAALTRKSDLLEKLASALETNLAQREEELQAAKALVEDYKAQVAIWQAKVGQIEAQDKEIE